jgi:predicted HTH transcriptional regulator
LPDPVFEYTGTSIVVTFKKAPGAVEKDDQKTREKILRLIREYPEITTSELAEKSGVTSKGVEWNINKLTQVPQFKNKLCLFSTSYRI